MTWWKGFIWHNVDNKLMPEKLFPEVSSSAPMRWVLGPDIN